MWWKYGENRVGHSPGTPFVWNEIVRRIYLDPYNFSKAYPPLPLLLTTTDTDLHWRREIQNTSGLPLQLCGRSRRDWLYYILLPLLYYWYSRYLLIAYVFGDNTLRNSEKKEKKEFLSFLYIVAISFLSSIPPIPRTL